MKSPKKVIKECDESLSRIEGWEKDCEGNPFRKCDFSHIKNYFETKRAEAASLIGKKK